MDAASRRDIVEDLMDQAEREARKMGYPPGIVLGTGADGEPEPQRRLPKEKHGKSEPEE